MGPPLCKTRDTGARCAAWVDWPFLAKMAASLTVIGTMLHLDHSMSLKVPCPVPYWYEGSHPAEVHSGLNAWSEAGFECHRAESKEEAALIVEEVPVEELSRRSFSGEYKPGRIKIKQGIPIDHVETVSAHEFGHFLGLGHNDEPGSLMAPVLSIPHPGPSMAELDTARKKNRDLNWRALFFSIGLLDPMD